VREKKKEQTKTDHSFYLKHYSQHLKKKKRKENNLIKGPRKKNNVAICEMFFLSSILSCLWCELFSTKREPRHS